MYNDIEPARFTLHYLPVAPPVTHPYPRGPRAMIHSILLAAALNIPDTTKIHDENLTAAKSIKHHGIIAGALAPLQHAVS